MKGEDAKKKDYYQFQIQHYLTRCFTERITYIIDSSKCFLYYTFIIFCRTCRLWYQSNAIVQKLWANIFNHNSYKMHVYYILMTGLRQTRSSLRNHEWRCFDIDYHQPPQGNKKLINHLIIIWNDKNTLWLPNKITPDPYCLCSLYDIGWRMGERNT